MADIELNEPDGAIGRLSPRELVALLDQIDPAGIAAANIDVDAIGRAIDPRKLDKNDLVRLLTAVDRLAAEGADVDLAGMGAKTFAALIANASRDQLQQVMQNPRLRERILGEVFRRMGDHLHAERAAGVDVVIHWRFTGGTGDGGYDRYESVISGGTCTVSRTMERSARATITLPPVEFLKLITNNASAPVLFMTGKLKVRGDLGFAATLTRLFDLPKP